MTWEELEEFCRSYKPTGRRSRFWPVVERVQAMTPEQFARSLKDAGILDENGNLAEKYRQPSKRRKKKKE